MTRLSANVGRAFYGRFEALRPVQSDAIAPLLTGQDVIVLSPTGSGKTEAVLAPLIERYLADARKARGPVLLHVTPTKALANDLYRRLEAPLESLGLLVGIRHGEQNDLRKSRKPDLLITTPESLDVMLSLKEPALGDICAIVLDEVHLTYNSQRGLHLGLLIQRLQTTLGRHIQIAALSATVATNRHIWEFFVPGRRGEVLQDASSREIDIQTRDIAKPAELGVLLGRLAEGGRLKALVFVDSRRECDALAAAWSEVSPFDGRVFAHHSSIDRDLRLATEDALQQPASAICVATSTLELGIDVGDIDLVVLYGVPGSWESFLQRIGRGNRRRDKANVLCVATPDHGDTFFQLLAFEALMHQILSGSVERARPMSLFGAAAQQVLSLVLEAGGGYVRVRELADRFTTWPHLTSSVLIDITQELVQRGYLRSHPFQNRVGANDGLHELHALRAIWGNFPSGSSALTVSRRERQIGTIPTTNLLRIRAGVEIRFAGRQWRVVRVSADDIQVVPGTGGPFVNISYGGGRPPFDPTIIEGMLHVLVQEEPLTGMAPTTATVFGRQADELRAHVDWSRIPYSQTSSGYRYATFAGKTVNEVLARHSGVSSFDAGEVVLRSSEPIDFSTISPNPADLLSLAIGCLDVPDQLTLFQQLLPPALLAEELGQVWLKTPVYERSLKRLRTAEVVRVSKAFLASLDR